MNPLASLFRFPGIDRSLVKALSRQRRLVLEKLEDRSLLAGLVSWWTGDNTALDSVGPNHGTLMNGVNFAAGKVGPAFSFDGVDDHIEIADSPSLQLVQSLTIEGWIKIATFPAVDQGEIFFRGDYRPGLDPYSLTTKPNGYLQFAISSATNVTSQVQVHAPQGEFIHVAATLDDATGEMNIYENGALVGHTTTTVRPFANLDPASSPSVGIGNTGFGTNYPFSGLIDEIKVYDKALTATEVLADYNAARTGGSPSISVADAATIEEDTHFGASLGAFVNQDANGGLARSSGMKFGPDGNLYVGSFLSSEVLRYNGSTGVFMGSFVTSGSGGLSQPAVGGLIFRPDGKLYVLSYGNGNVLRFDSVSGAFLDVFVSSGSGGLTEPKGMAFGPDGNLYVSSSSTNQILRYNGTTGASMGVFVSAGSGGLSNPRLLSFGPDGKLYVANVANHTVLRFSGSTGAFLDTFIPSNSGGLTGPGEMLFHNGSLYVASQGTDEILRYDAASGAFLDTVDAANSGDMDRPIALLLDPSGKLLAGCYDDIIRFDSVQGVAFTVTLSSPRPEPITIDYATANGTALAGSDYASALGTLTFVPGEMTKTIPVPTIGDTAIESNETFVVNLTNPVGATIADAQGVGTIIDNDTGVNQAPIGTDKTVSVLEDGVFTFATSDFGFTDPNDAPANSLLAVKITTLPASGSLANNGTAVSAGDFIAVAGVTGGKLKFTPAANANGSPYTSFKFQVQDNGGTASGGVNLDQSAKTITVSATSVNDPPAGTDKTVGLLEDGVFAFATSDFGFTDTTDSPANNLLAVKITTLPASGSLANNGTAVSADDFIPVADITGGKLKFTPAGNANGTPYTSFKFQVQDNGGTASGGVNLDQSANTITLNVASVNDAPVADSQLVRTFADKPLAITLTGLDLDGDSLSFAVATGPAHGTLSGTPPNLTYLPASLYFGNDALTFKASDGVLDSAAASVSIVVRPPNQKPVANNQSVNTAEDTNKAITLSGSDADGDAVAFTIVANPAHGILSGTALNVTYTPLSNFNGADSFSYKANDGTDDSNTATVSIAIHPVNDPPQFAKGFGRTVTDEDGPQSIAGWATGMSAGPPDELGQAVHFVVTTNRNDLFTAQPQVDPTGKLTFTPAPNVRGTAEITVTLQDNAGVADGGLDTSSPRSFDIIVTKPFPWRNARNLLDVNGDGLISPLDVLLIINRINVPNSGPIPTDAAIGAPYLDTYTDGFINPLDALLVINFINANISSGGEGEEGGPLAATTTVFQKLGNQDSKIDWESKDLQGLIAVVAADAELPARTKVGSPLGRFREK